MSSIKHGRAGKTYWRSLDELAGDPEFERFVRNEFPALADEMLAPASRRHFLKFMGASMALAGMTACRWPVEEILPFTSRPEGYVPGETMQFATAMECDGAGTGILVTSYDGRPIKIEGNPEHPASLGGTSAQAQAAILELYDPDRSRQVVRLQDGGVTFRTWKDYDAFAADRVAGLSREGGSGLRVLSGTSSSPSVASIKKRFLASFPRARWHEYEPVARENERRGTALAFGRPYRVEPAIGPETLIVSLDEDLLLSHPAAVRHARDFARGRRGENGRMNRLLVVESGHSTTGAMADRRIPLAPGRIPAFAACLAAGLFLDLGLSLPPGASGLAKLLQSVAGHPLRESAGEIARELAGRRGDSLLMAGPRQPAEVHALVHVINSALGNVDQTVRYHPDADPDREDHVESIRSLVADMEGGAVDTLLILGGNPVFDAPGDLEFESKLSSVPLKIHLGLYRDETAAACDWHLPRAHFLESWGDARAWDGTWSVVQPLIEPLNNGRSEIELLAGILGETPATGYEIVRGTFREKVGPAGFEKTWRRTLHDGLLRESRGASARPRPQAAGWPDRLSDHLAVREPEGDVLELAFLQDPSIHDGRFANNGWLQELPEPLTKLTWDNALLVGPATAGALGLGQEDLARVHRDGRSVELPVYIVPGQAEGSAGVWTGYGRRNAGRVGDGVGVDVYPIRTSDAMGWAGVRVEKTGRTYPLATTQNHWAIDARGAEEAERRVAVHARELPLAEFLKHPEAVQHMGIEYHPVKLWKEFEYTGHKWGMTIDLAACHGCNSCVVACQAENNIPVVGKDEVARGREMHWIRVDRYFSGDPEAPSVTTQPVTCHHCENAPCEQVCPVAATVHDHEGLNVMVYNRCVGTRYCLNNCPYKVRRFNWFNNHKHETEIERMQYNPEVTVRSRGVMEKCSFCVQRINAVKIQAKNAGRAIEDGEITTACAQACPANAITFGDLNDPESAVGRLQRDPRAYSLLDEMNVKPRTRYLARLKNHEGAS